MVDDHDVSVAFHPSSEYDDTWHRCSDRLGRSGSEIPSFVRSRDTSKCSARARTRPHVQSADVADRSYAASNQHFSDRVIREWKIGSEPTAKPKLEVEMRVACSRTPRHRHCLSALYGIARLHAQLARMSRARLYSVTPIVRCAQPKRIGIVDRITRSKPVQVEPTAKPDGVKLSKAPRVRIVISIPQIRQSRRITSPSQEISEPNLVGGGPHSTVGAVRAHGIARPVRTCRGGCVAHRARCQGSVGVLASPVGVRRQ